jgi:hypothetical protein
MKKELFVPRKEKTPKMNIVFHQNGHTCAQHGVI